MSESVERAPRRRRAWLIAAAVAAVIVVAALVALPALLRLGATPVRIEGVAMSPALNDGDRALFRRPQGRLERGDIVIFRLPRDTSLSYVKRVVALPGETIEIRGGRVLIDGRALEEPYVEAKNNASVYDDGPLRVPEKHYYVMGDNRDNSADSRVWGAIEESHVYGKLVARY